MKDASRAERRRNNARLYKKYYKEGLNQYRCSTEEQHESWARRNAQRRVNTRTLCSCRACGNLRWVEGDTFQERRSRDSMNDALKEVLTN